MKWNITLICSVSNFKNVYLLSDINKLAVIGYLFILLDTFIYKKKNVILIIICKHILLLDVI